MRPRRVRLRRVALHLGGGACGVEQLGQAVVLLLYLRRGVLGLLLRLALRHRRHVGCSHLLVLGLLLLGDRSRLGMAVLDPLQQPLREVVHRVLGPHQHRLGDARRQRIAHGRLEILRVHVGGETNDAQGSACSLPKPPCSQLPCSTHTPYRLNCQKQPFASVARLPGAFRSSRTMLSTWILPIHGSGCGRLLSTLQEGGCTTAASESA